ncbi:hypothetical protein [Alkalicoccobacillus plakortidis]|uniref:Uncharacterized protein n=1 Tax=Alkalicoccobacillus plakortidis TaxID=444060 RepID=A0ABT0XE75_9BACI|nr:hypothetical protein [Alkalicoccobacillus plakortidis]MCM2674115.1 hypothetical protein [Alkalicoccobacillus plakortidis]
MDRDAIKTVKEIKDVEDFKGLRFLASFFWMIPLSISLASFGGLGPIIGTVVTIIMLILCIPHKARKIMYFIFSVPLPFIGIIGGISGILFGLLFGAIIGLISFFNYTYLTQLQQLRTYEDEIKIPPNDYSS